MKVSPDTNILVRFIVRDDETQARTALRLLERAEVIAISLPCLCEFAWVLARTYRFGKSEISAAIHSLLNTENVAMNRPAVEAGLAVLHAGGDFADGVMAYEGKWLGGEIFVSFDKKAISLLEEQGYEVRLLR